MLNSLANSMIGMETVAAKGANASLLTAHILVVDDEPSARTQIGEQLRAGGFENVQFLSLIHI